MCDIGRDNIDYIAELIESLGKTGYDMEIAKRLFGGGEWGLSFREVYFAATEDGAFYRENEVDLERLNNLFSRTKRAEHLGYPL